jgi:hypothetical protein
MFDKFKDQINAVMQDGFTDFQNEDDAKQFIKQFPNYSYKQYNSKSKGIIFRVGTENYFTKFEESLKQKNNQENKSQPEEKTNNSNYQFFGQSQKGASIGGSASMVGFDVNDKFYDIGLYNGRPMTIVNLNGTSVPFYCTTGAGGKNLVPGWYPFFGMDVQDEWINKTNKEEMENFYGDENDEVSKQFREVHEALNDIYGTNADSISQEMVQVIYGDGMKLRYFGGQVENIVNASIPVIPTKNGHGNAKNRIDSNVKLMKQYIKNGPEYSQQLVDAAKNSFSQLQSYFEDYMNNTIKIKNNVYVSYTLNGQKFSITIHFSQDDQSLASKLGDIVSHAINGSYQINGSLYTSPPTENILIEIKPNTENQKQARLRSKLNKLS